MANFLAALISEQDLAKQFGLTVWALRAWAKRDYGPSRVKLGRKVYYRIVEVEAFVTERLQASGS